MRVTGNVINNGLVGQLNTLTARQYRLQNQATTGLRISAPEDDPAAMGQALRLKREDQQLAQFAKNVTTLQNRTGVISNALQALKQISDRATEIAAQADGTQSDQALQTLAVEVKQLIQQAVQMANSKDGDQYIFAGTRSDQTPFVTTTDSSGNVTAVTYQGNTSTMPTEIGTNTSVATDAPGENSSGTGQRGVLVDSRYGADFFNHLIALQNHLQSGDTNAIAGTDRAALAKDEENIIFQNANNGVMVSRLEAAASALDNQQSSVQDTLTKVAGADLTQTLVELSQAQNAYQVAAQSSSKLLQLQQILLSYLP
jgi:flagellar hook-associated protein 3 FlgL